MAPRVVVPERRGGAFAQGGFMKGKLCLAGLDTIAGAVGCSRKTLYKWIRNKGFPAFKMDEVWRALPREIEEWLWQQRDKMERSV